MPSLVLTPFTAGEAVELGNRQWVKKILPVGDVDYKGRVLHFDKTYLGRLVDAFRSRAYDQVPFQLADAHNTHTNDPERTRGEITGMELRDDGLYVTAALTPEGEQVLTSNPKLGVSARIVEEYARSDGKRFTAAIQHVLGTLDPRIPGLGPWQAIEAASPVPDRVLDLSGLSFAGEDSLDLAWIPDPTQAQWAAIDAKGGKSLPDAAGGSDEDKADSHIAFAKKATAMGNHQLAVQHLARASTLTSDPGKQAAISKLNKGVAQHAIGTGKGSQLGLAGDSTEEDASVSSVTEGTGMADLDALTDEQKARLSALLELPEDQLDALAGGGIVVTADELEALTSPAGDEDAGEDEGDGFAAQIASMSDEDFAALQAEFEAETEGEPVGATLSSEAQFAIDLATARADEALREAAVFSARLAEQDYQAEKRRLADMGVPPFITELARPLLEGAGHVVEMSNGKGVDSGQVMRRVLTEYAKQVRLLDLTAEEGSPFDEPEGAGADEKAVQGRDDIVSRYKQMTGLK